MRKMRHLPSYKYLSPQEWDLKIEGAEVIASACSLCPRRCGVNRLKGLRGFCGAGSGLTISSIFPHHGEEPPVSGTGGSGTVFFTHCTLKCVYCQNYQISHEGEGGDYSVSGLAGSMLDLQKRGCHNINLVTPTHYLPWILMAIRESVERGLEVPIVYNCGGYELSDTLKLLRGVVDIYLPDMKYGDDGPALKYSMAKDYVSVNREAVREMFRQTGPLKTDENGIAARGLCIRHLVLPGGGAGSGSVVSFLRENFDPQDIYISLMAQYHPSYRACEFPEISRRVSIEEYDAVRKLFLDAGFNGYYQEHSRLDESFLINFLKQKSEPLK